MSTSSNKFQFIGRIVFAVAVLVILDYVQVHSFLNFENELYRLIISLVLIGINAIHIHFIIHSILKLEQWVEKAKESHSFACHFCNADPEHCFSIKSKPMPICSRHLGYYGGLIILGISILLNLDGWINFSTSIQWQIHLAIFFILLIIVVIEGGLGKAKKISVGNKIRFINGITSAVGVVFFMTFIVSLFKLFEVFPLH